ncbi:MAG TPA: PASTA domain-containing protein [Trebonia sp.]|nr:PASTA domain-containing protein [Trebonia sp.]
MNADEQRLADLLKRVVPEPPRQLTYEEITVRTAERTVKSWLLPSLAAASVLVIGGTVGAVAATRSGPAGPGAPAAYQGTSRAGSATPAARPTPTGCQPMPEPTSSAPAGGSVTVPGIVGQRAIAAEQVLQTAGLTVTIKQAVSPAVPAGIVLSQSPATGTHVAPGATITLTIASGSAGAKPTSVPTPASTCLTTAPPAGAPTPSPTTTAAGGGAPRV